MTPQPYDDAYDLLAESCHDRWACQFHNPAERRGQHAEHFHRYVHRVDAACWYCAECGQPYTPPAWPPPRPGSHESETNLGWQYIWAVPWGDALPAFLLPGETDAHTGRGGHDEFDIARAWSRAKETA